MRELSLNERVAVVHCIRMRAAKDGRMNAAPETQTRTMQAEDLYQLFMASDAQISPNGTSVVFVKTWLDEEKNGYRSSLYSVSVDGGEEQRLTAADAQDNHPRWSPDGNHIAFLSDRSEKPQVFVLPVGGGEAWKLTDLEEGVTSFTWSPDGSTIAVTSKTEAKEKARENDEAESDVVHITSIRYKANGVPGFLDGKRSHIWCVSFPKGDSRQITHGDFDDSNPAWSPSGQEIVFVSDRTEHREYGRARQIWSVHARGGEPRLIVGGENDTFGDPVVSPDSQTIAMRGHRNAVAGGSINTRIWTVPMSGGEPVCLTEGFDRSTDDSTAADFYGKASSGLIWTDDGSAILTQVSDEGNVHLYQIPADGRVKPLISGIRRVLNYSVAAGKIAFTASDPVDPSDVYVCDADGSNERRLTTVSKSFLSGVTLNKPEEFRVKSHNEDGWDVHGWIMKPPQFEEGAKYPMVLQIHGGPHGMYGNAFFHEFQTLAAAGYVVVYCNPRGSQGYGEEFCSCTRGCWGESDMPDVMAVVDHVIEQGYVDPNRMGVTGGSYGGYLTNWIIGHSDRFAAAITDRCVSNFYSMYGTSDIGFSFLEYEAGGNPPWEHRETYIKYSPITYVENMVTPLLIVHSEQDYRCPIEQAEQMFIFLKKLGRTVEFVRFPNENHELSRSGQPKHRIQRIQFNLDWWDRYL
jgi:dipeptidyl aminopeptidase/acylaminoacyl peptidase